jgi:hypothetical protein
MSITTKSGMILWDIQKGTSAELAISKSDGWDMYDEIRMDIKNDRDILSHAILKLNPGNGITLDSNRLLVSLTYGQTAALRQKVVYADIKLRIGSTVLDPIPIQITLKETVTKL